MVKRALKVLVPLIILIILGRAIIENWIQIQEKLVLNNPIYFLLFILCLVLTHFAGAYFWFKVTGLYSSKVSFKESFRVFVVSNFGRFVPGIALHYAARVYLSKKLGLKIKEGVSLVVLEAYYTLAGAFVLSFTAFPVVLVKIPNSWLITLLFFVALLLIFLTPPQIVFNLLKKVSYFRKIIPEFKNFSFNWHIMLLLIPILSFFLNGLAFWFLSASLHEIELSKLIPIIGLFCISWAIGFLTPVAPGGLGVTDLSLALLLGSFYDFSFASFLVLVYRFGLIFSEGIVFLFVVKLYGFNMVFSNNSKDS